MTDPGTWSPGWYPDPTGRHEYRYWHGGAWTDAVADHGATSSDPPAMPPPAPTTPPETTAPEAGPPEATTAVTPAAATTADAETPDAETPDVPSAENSTTSGPSWAAPPVGVPGPGSPTQDVPVQDAPVQDAPVQDAPTQQTPTPPSLAPNPTLTVPSTTGKRRVWWVLAAAATVMVVLLSWAIGWFVWLRPGPGPVGLAAPSVTGTSVSLSWSRPAEGAAPEHYVIRRDGVDVATIGGETSYEDSGLEPLTAYHYRVLGVVHGQRTRPTAEVVVRTHPAAPTGATSGTVTADSVVLNWSPPQGVTPDRYIVLRDGNDIATVPVGTLTYRDTSLSPGSSFSYSVVAITRGQRSDPSAEVKVTTLTPPVPNARLQDSWDVTVAVTDAGKSRLKVGDKELDSWEFTPSCATGPCSVSLSATFSGKPYKVTLKRNGAVYQGSAKVHLVKCAGADVTDTVTVTAKVTAGEMRGGSWVASDWTGRVVLSMPYTRSGNYYCPTQSVTFSATPGSSTPAPTA